MRSLVLLIVAGSIPCFLTTPVDADDGFQRGHAGWHYHPGHGYHYGWHRDHRWESPRTYAHGYHYGSAYRDSARYYQPYDHPSLYRPSAFGAYSLYRPRYPCYAPVYPYHRGISVQLGPVLLHFR